MSRLIFLFAIAAVIYLLLKSYRKADDPAGKQTSAEDMVRCAHCGVHLPVSESVRAGELYFCSTAHRDAHKK